MNMIEIKNLIKSFPGLYAPILDKINLSLKPGDFCIIIGANGSGKSTLLKTISKEHMPTFGTVTVQGRIAQVVQDVNVGTVPEMTLLENIALSLIKNPKLYFYKRFKNTIIKEIQKLDISLEKYLDTPLKALSGGQRQIIATLAALTSDREILLLDEHTSALDHRMQEFLMEYTARRINDRGLTSVMITHKLNDAINYGNRLIMLYEGKIVFDISGNPKRNLKVSDLLALFHYYEDQTLQGIKSSDKFNANAFISTKLNTASSRPNNKARRFYDD